MGHVAPVSDSFRVAPIEIRPAARADSAGLARVQVDSYRNAYAGLLPAAYLAQFSYEEQEHDWRDLLTGPMTDLLLVAQSSGGRVAGYALGRPRPAADGLPYDAELVALHVRREYQRQGIRRRLVSAMARALHEAGGTSLLLYVLAGNPAGAFYERLGATRVGEKRWMIDELGVEICELAYAWDDIVQAELVA
jgi:ribosomal protein S18 acetylase RimI-like enzyme